jgi:uncharacterized protein (DUF2141 family)
VRANVVFKVDFFVQAHGNLTLTVKGLKTRQG